MILSDNWRKLDDIYDDKLVQMKKHRDLLSASDQGKAVPSHEQQEIQT